MHAVFFSRQLVYDFKLKEDILLVYSQSARIFQLNPLSKICSGVSSSRSSRKRKKPGLFPGNNQCLSCVYTMFFILFFPVGLCVCTTSNTDTIIIFLITTIVLRPTKNLSGRMISPGKLNILEEASSRKIKKAGGKEKSFAWICVAADFPKYIPGMKVTQQGNLKILVQRSQNETRVAEVKTLQNAR